MPYGLGHVCGGDPLRAGWVGVGAGDLDDAVIGVVERLGAIAMDLD